MLDAPWTCPHCDGHSPLPSAVDERIITCEACKFSFAAHQQVANGSTWREQAALFETAGEAWPKFRSDRYRVIRAIATGAQGRILLAHHCHLDQICILKIIATQDEWRELATARLQAEARAGALVAHQNVARVLDCDCVDDTWYFAMEYIEGENLRKMLNAVGSFCWQQVVEIGVQIANGLEAIHQANLIHRDIKPSNIMLVGDGSAKITDLGLVKIKGIDGDLALTCDGQILGTPYYMAPEKCDGD
ncbi:MAG: serine/threonine protein kinase, partial [Planctomycetes bacterium]|nr:serine/threonine protein kinase [Planctomycetota bacterium]